MHTASPPAQQIRRTNLRRLALSAVVLPLAVGIASYGTTAAAVPLPAAQVPSATVDDPGVDPASEPSGQIQPTADLQPTEADQPAADVQPSADQQPGADVQPNAAARCTLGAKLVPTCGHLWGAAPAAFSHRPRTQTLAEFEAAQKRQIDIYHGYHTNGQRFPTDTERQVSLNPSNPRLLLLNWRPALDQTWAAVANGKIDARIDAAARNMKSYPQKFFLAIWAEGEHFVRQNAGSGMMASDYRNMVRHVITRLKSQGVNNAVFTQINQGYPKYASQSWWPSMYPGDDVIDWLAVDSYNSGRSGGYNSGNFHDMMNRTLNSWKGWYRWATSQHPSKPLMLAEWGVWANRNEPSRMAWFYDQVRAQLKDYPKLKALVYFNTTNHPEGDTAITTNSSSLQGYQRLTASIQRVNLANRK